MAREWSIREPSPDDAAQMLAFARRIGGETDNLLFGPEGLPLNEEQERQYLANCSDGMYSWMYVAEADGMLVGTCSMTRGRRARAMHRAELSAAVAKSHWSRGIGTAMLKRLLEEGRAVGVTAFTLEVRADNAAAVHVYEKLGFRTVGRLERFFRINGQYHAALLMELDA